MGCMLPRRRKKSPNLLWGATQNSGRAPFSQSSHSGRAQFNQSSHSGRAPFNHSSHSGRAPFNLSSHSVRAHFNQLGNILSTLPPLHSLELLPLLCMHSWLSPISHTLSSRQGPTHPSTPLVHSGLGCGLWPRYGHLETMQAVRLK
jgi:hypothetical protein